MATYNQVTHNPSTVAPANIGGFQRYTTTVARRRLVAAIAGVDKSGKSHQALTMPGPIAYADLDVGLEGMVEKFAQKKNIYTTKYRVHVPQGATVEQTARAANEVWEQFKRDIRAAYASTVIRSIVVDTETATWGLIRLARFGKLLQVKAHHYGPVNNEYVGLFNEVFETDKNLMLLDRLQDEWENYLDSQGKEQGKKTGKLERKGMKDIPFLAQVNAICRYNAQAELGERFTMEIVNSRQNMDIAGIILPQETCNFATLGQMVYPGTSESDWL